MNGNSELSVSSSEAELRLRKASVKSLNAATNSGENSNLVLNKLQADKWAKDRLLWPVYGGERPGLSWWGGRMLLSLHLSILWLLTSKDPLTDWLSHMQMEKRGYALSCYCMSVCVRERDEAVSWVQSLARPHRAARRTGCPSLHLRVVKQSPAILALS